MPKFKVGDRVKATEKTWDADREETVAVEVVGTVVEEKDAFEVYPKKPIYRKRDKKTPKSETKYPMGTKVYRVKIDGEKHVVRTTRLSDGRVETEYRDLGPRNFHEDQLSHA